MQIEILAIGDEILHGMSVNTNASFLSKRLLEEGFSVIRHQVVGDDPEQLKKALQETLSRGVCVLTTGGLGPTCDDKTRQIISDFFRTTLKIRPEIHQKLQERYGKDFPTLSDQAMLPESAIALENRQGTASGFLLENGKLFPKSLLIAMPGVPAEMKDVFENQVLPLLHKRFDRTSRMFVKILYFAGLKESDIDPLLRQIEKEMPRISCGIYPSYESIAVHLKTNGKSQEEADSLFSPPLKQITEKLGKHLFESPSGHLNAAVHKILIDKKLTLSCAESCTGGKLGLSFVENPDASLYFKGSVVAYSNVIKEQILGIDPDLLFSKGAVSVEVTCQMAENARKLFNTDCALAVSGILGPKGGTSEKPVGTVAASIARDGYATYSWMMHLRGNRAILLERCVNEILGKFLFLLQDDNLRENNFRENN